MFESDTIAAISTALGNSGINIIRISGENSFRVIKEIFKKGKSKSEFDVDNYDSHTIHYGYIVDENEVVDEVMVSVFKAPNSYTTENVIEINCHGSSYIAKKILTVLVKHQVRIAKPGEFSKRAFLNGRIDLSQAEAVMDLIQSQNEYSAKSSLNQLSGSLSDRIKTIREDILYEVAFIESALDDPEHYSLDGYNEELEGKIRNCFSQVEGLISSFSKGRIISDGIKTVIAGRPNAGKSSLMNNLLNEDKAIVTDIPGTTRDVIEYSVNIGKLTLNLIDTAGIHDTKDIIEKMGIEKSFESIDMAGLVLYVIDSSDDFNDEDLKLYEKIKSKPHIVILNKSDITNDFINSDIFKDSVTIRYSTVDGTGFDELISTIENMFYENDIDVENEIYISNLRHYELLKLAKDSLNNVIMAIDSDLSEDMVTIDMMDAYTYLGEIIGETVTDDLVDKIFSEFCMGK